VDLWLGVVGDGYQPFEPPEQGDRGARSSGDVTRLLLWTPVVPGTPVNGNLALLVQAKAVQGIV